MKKRKFWSKILSKVLLKHWILQKYVFAQLISWWRRYHISYICVNLFWIKFVTRNVAPNLPQSTRKQEKRLRLFFFFHGYLFNWQTWTWASLDLHSSASEKNIANINALGFGLKKFWWNSLTETGISETNVNRFAWFCATLRDSERNCFFSRSLIIIHVYLTAVSEYLCPLIARRPYKHKYIKICQKRMHSICNQILSVNNM